MIDHYAISRPGSLEAESATEHATGADWDQALADAQKRSIEDGDYRAIRHVSGHVAQIIATVGKGEILWPRQSSPHVDLETGYLLDQPELEAG